MTPTAKTVPAGHGPTPFAGHPLPSLLASTLCPKDRKAEQQGEQAHLWLLGESFGCQQRPRAVARGCLPWKYSHGSASLWRLFGEAVMAYSGPHKTTGGEGGCSCKLLSEALLVGKWPELVQTGVFIYTHIPQLGAFHMSSLQRRLAVKAVVHLHGLPDFLGGKKRHAAPKAGFPATTSGGSLNLNRCFCP